MNLSQRYGKNALIAGGSEGLGAAFAMALAKDGMNLFLVGRRLELLIKTQQQIQSQFSIQVKTIVCDLSAANALSIIQNELNEIEIDVLIYNAAQSYIGKFESADVSLHERIVDVNVRTPLKLVHHFGSEMIKRKRGAVILMTSLSGKQGSAYITTYAASKAFDLILAESLWYEWRKHNVDVIGCIAGATATPNFINSKPGKLGLFEPQVQSPDSVVSECLNKLGKVPSFISGGGNRLASFFMHKLFGRKLAVNIMGDSTKKLYQHYGLE